MPLSAEELRLLNLIELLVEQARELHVETLQEPPDDAYKTW